MMEYEDLLEQGETLAGEGLVEGALSRFEQALALAPEEPEVIEAVGRALLELGRVEEAEASFVDALDLDPSWAAPRLGLAAVSTRREEPFKVVHHLERAIEADPEAAETYAELGRYYGNLGEVELARATFGRWTEAHPEDSDMFISAGLTLFDAGDYPNALGFFEAALEAAEDPQQVSGARTFRANALDMLGRYPEAVATYEEVIDTAPDWWEAHANLGICHARNSRAEAAESALRRGLTECPGSPEIRDELAAHLLSESRSGATLQEALSLAEEAVALGRDEPRHLHTLAESRLANGDTDGAAEAYQSVLDLDSSDPAAHLELGLIQESLGAAPEAERHFMESLKGDPANPRALYSYASLYYAAENFEAAEELLARSLSADPGYSPALSALASIRARSGDYDSALEYIERAVEAGERDVEHFKNAQEFLPLHEEPEFRALLLRMVEG
jgi:tetratricopeptide (TPR) repeat protein